MVMQHPIGVFHDQIPEYDTVGMLPRREGLAGKKDHHCVKIVSSRLPGQDLRSRFDHRHPMRIIAGTVHVAVLRQDIDAAENGVETRVEAVDNIPCGNAATYIKADVEGADYETLLGMRKTIKSCKPKLNFAAYHRFEDIFRLPLFTHELNPDYKIYLRHHPYIPAWDTNLYCV